jgi:hypothetical protein
VEFPDLVPFSANLQLDLGRVGQRNFSPHFACDTQLPESACSRGVAVEGEAPPVPGPIVLVGPERSGRDRAVEAWNPLLNPGEELPWEGCRGDGRFPQVRAGSGEHLIRLRFDASDREKFQFQREEYGKLVTKDAREELLVSHALTQYGGELPRQKTVLRNEVDDASAEVDVTYTPPEQSKKKGEAIPDNGRLVRFFLGLRDQRGGSDYTTRELCLLPP